ncbi:hypothetical protein O6V14_04610 [Sphingomonas faeni]|uniref:phage adaptor protein n=1 Tax=Sphingomonas faeni TaxID=185950 RepID=UPI003356A09A
MTTSGSIASTLLASEVIKSSMQELGVLAAGENPTAEDLALGLRSLNFLLKSWAARGLTSWRDQDGTLAVPAGAREIALDPYCIDVTEARVVQATNYERPLQRWEMAQYRQLPNKATPGFPTSYAVQKTATGIALLLWPVPSVSTTILYSFTRIIEDVTDGDQTLDLPQEWLEAVYVALAARLAQPLGVTRLDPATAQIVIQRSLSLENELFDADRPASIYMGSAYGRYF